MVSLESQPFSSCAMASALITADCFWSGGYFATSRSIFFKESAFSIKRARSSIDLAENDVLGPDDRHRVRDHVAARHLVQRGEVREARGAQLQAVGLVRAIGYEVHPEFALRRF